VAGIAREVLPAQGKRALNKFFTEYDCDEQQFNHERLEELQRFRGGASGLKERRASGT
jgi:hypothetical protein